MLNKINNLIMTNPEIGLVILTACIGLVVLALKNRARKRVKSKIVKIIGEYRAQKTISGLVLDVENPGKAYSLTPELEEVVLSLFNKLKLIKKKKYNYLEKTDGNLKLKAINLSKEITHKHKSGISTGKEVFTEEVEEIDFDATSSIAVLSNSGIGKTHLAKVIVAQANMLKIRCKIVSSHSMDFPYKTLNPFIHEEEFKELLYYLIQRIYDNKRAEPTLLVLDEVQAWLPGQSKEVKKSIEDIINQGRKFGVYILLSSQSTALAKLSSKIGLDLTTVSYLAIGGTPNEATIAALGVPPIKRIHQKDLRGLFYCGRSELRPIKVFSQVKKAGYGELIK